VKETKVSRSYQQHQAWAEYCLRMSRLNICHRQSDGHSSISEVVFAKELIDPKCVVALRKPLEVSAHQGEVHQQNGRLVAGFPEFSELQQPET
jgi:hypothetical protein